VASIGKCRAVIPVCSIILCAEMGMGRALARIPAVG